MLAKLSIKNVALIEQAEISFDGGLNVLSGETGAGKSVILDSVNFVLGAKADRSMIRYGEAECMVKAEFFVDENSKAVQTLREFDIESDGEIIISRRFSAVGKNSIKINGCTVTASMLRQVTDNLVDVHGQSEHFYLLKESNQLKLLDTVVGRPLLDEKQALQNALKEKRLIDEKIAMLGGNEMERARRLELLSYQIEEILSVDLKDGEEEALLVQRDKMMHLEKIINGLQEASTVLSGDVGVLDGLHVAVRAINPIVKYDDNYAAFLERLENLQAELEDVSEALADAGNELYFDENQVVEIEARLDAIRTLKRKYGANKEQIDAYLQAIQSEHDLLQDCEGQYASLMQKRAKTVQEIYTICKKITQLRKQTAETFTKQIVEELKTLNMSQPQFTIEFSVYTEQDAEHATQNGLDNVTFLFSANAGEPVKPLGKIISGGEMSRFMLAVKTRLSGLNGIVTYIFDEIDAGISGKTAKVVGEKLAKISKNTQIIAVSHLAQIACMSDNAFLIEKAEKDGKTLTRVEKLDANARLSELVRLLGGNDDNAFALKHAQELVHQARDFKTSI